MLHFFHQLKWKWRHLNKKYNKKKWLPIKELNPGRLDLKSTALTTLSLHKNWQNKFEYILHLKKVRSQFSQLFFGWF